MSNILIIEDDENISEVLDLILTAEGHHCRRAKNGTKGLEEIEKEEPDIITLDLMLGEDDTGIDICRKIRERYSQRIVIIVITAKGDKITKALASEHRVDWFLEKPFDADLLKTYVRNLSRRIQEITKEAIKSISEELKAHQNEEKKTEQGVITSGFLTLDLVRNRLYAVVPGRGTIEIKVTEQEVKVLNILLSRREETVTRKELLKEAWGTVSNVQRRNVDKQICTIRKKLDDAYGRKTNMIITKTQGYSYVGMQKVEIKELMELIKWN
jgi:DNA-binding response OmpR family regulator